MRLTVVWAGLVALGPGCGADGPEGPGAQGEAPAGEAAEDDPSEAAAADTTAVSQGAPTDAPILPAPPFEPRITNWHCPEGWAPSPDARSALEAVGF